MSKLDSTLLHLNEAEGFISVTSKLQSEFAHGMVFLDSWSTKKLSNSKSETRAVPSGWYGRLGMLGRLGTRLSSSESAPRTYTLQVCPLQSVAIPQVKILQILQGALKCHTANPSLHFPRRLAPAEPSGTAKRLKSKGTSAWMQKRSLRKAQRSQRSLIKNT